MRFGTILFLTILLGIYVVVGIDESEWYLTFVIESDTECVCSIYVDSGDGFSEIQRFDRHIERTTSPQRIRIPFVNVKSVRNLRVDPIPQTGNNSATFSIKQAKLCYDLKSGFTFINPSLNLDLSTSFQNSGVQILNSAPEIAKFIIQPQTVDPQICFQNLNLEPEKSYNSRYSIPLLVTLLGACLLAYGGLRK